MPEMIMLVGVPGSGKSTWLEQNEFWEMPNMMILSTDNYIETVAAGHGKTYNDVFTDTIGLAEKNLDECLRIAVEAGMDIVWDQTNLTVRSRMSKLRRIPHTYRKIAYVFPTPPQKEWHSRLNSQERAGKVIPEHILQSMATNFHYPTRDEGFDDVFFLGG